MTCRKRTPKRFELGVETLEPKTNNGQHISLSMSTPTSTSTSTSIHWMCFKFSGAQLPKTWKEWPLRSSLSQWGQNHQSSAAQNISMHQLLLTNKSTDRNMLLNQMPSNKINTSPNQKQNMNVHNKCRVEILNDDALPKLISVETSNNESLCSLFSRQDNYE